MVLRRNDLDTETPIVKSGKRVCFKRIMEFWYIHASLPCYLTTRLDREIMTISPLELLWLSTIVDAIREVVDSGGLHPQQNCSTKILKTVGRLPGVVRVWLKLVNCHHWCCRQLGWLLHLACCFASMGTSIVRPCQGPAVFSSWCTVTESGSSVDVFSHQKCKYCSYNLYENPLEPEAIDPHTLSQLNGTMPVASVKDCRCSSVTVFTPSEGTVSDYKVKVYGHVGSHRALMRSAYAQSLSWGIL